MKPLHESDDVWAELKARGLQIHRGKGDLADLPPPRKAPPGPPMSEILDELREDTV